MIELKVDQELSSSTKNLFRKHKSIKPKTNQDRYQRGFQSASELYRPQK